MVNPQPEIKVKVVRRADRRNLVFRWFDPVTGRKGESTARTPNRSVACRRIRNFVKGLEETLRKPADLQEMTWVEACDRYAAEHLIKRRKSTGSSWRTARHRFEGIVDPVLLADLDASGVSRFEAALHGQVSPHSTGSYLRSLRVFARWATRIFPGYTAPEIRVEKSGSKGRPLSLEEFERMLAACEKVVPHRGAGSWRFLLRGLRRSGLRLGQALALSWEPDAPIHIYGMDGQRPKMHISEESHKGKRVQILPLIPPMRALLRRVPSGQRNGFVFNPKLAKGITRSLITVSAKICAIGQTAGIRVGTRLKRDRKTGEVTTVPRFAGAHDLKRTFIQRLINLGLHPVDVARFGQHKDFQTTMDHYTERDADRLADRMTNAFRKRRSGKRKGAISGDTPSRRKSTRRRKI